MPGTGCGRRSPAEAGRYQANLLRIHDIQCEIENQLEPLEAAAEKARQYKGLAARLRQVKVTRLLQPLVSLEQDKARLARDLDSLQQLLEKLAELNAALETQAGKLETRRQQQEAEYSTYQEGILAQEKEAAGYRSKQAYCGNGSVRAAAAWSSWPGPGNG